MRTWGDLGGRNHAVEGGGRGPGGPDASAHQGAHRLPGCEDMSKDRKQKTAEISERRVVAWGEAAEGLTGAASWRRWAGRP